MLSRPVDPLIDALISYVGPDAHKFVAIEVGGASRQLPALEIGEQCVVFGSAESSVTIETAAGQLRQEKPSFHSDNEAYEIVYVLKGSMIQQGQREVVGRGVSVVDMHTGIGRMVGLPAGWLDRQERLINQALQPLKVGESVELAQLSARVDGDSFDALNWITGQLFQWRRSTNVPIYLRAEAGKGKSTILAETARRELRACSGPLPIFVPMRSIQRGVGISWEEIVSTVGVVGSDAESLKAAVRSGLVVPLLDGLDEVSGRYDPTVVQGIVQIILQELRTDKSRLLVSGRTTEAGSIPAEDALEVGLELPDSDDESFQRYCEIVVGYIADEWPQLQKQIPEPPFTQTEVPETTSTRGERETIVNWLKRVFGDLGKERSLFFVQSLACIGRHYQLAGNQPFLIPSREEPATRPPLFDVCDLAASLACVREQEKIEDLAHDHFTPREQVELLTWLALRSSAAESEQDEMPRPNELASDVFGIDPVNQNELFTAVVRQLQKHALLFASGTGNVRAGAWRPQFLSDWVRAALIVRAWLHRDRMLGDGTKIASLIVPKAERAQYAFRYLIPEMVEKDEFDGLRKLTTVLLEHVEAGSPEASSN